MVTDTVHGGYKLDDNEIGLIYSVSATIQVVYMVSVTPPLVGSSILLEYCDELPHIIYSW